MKSLKLFSTICLSGILFLNACKGPEGPIGPQGSTGTAGTNGTNGNAGIAGATGGTGAEGAAGATGAQGPMGNANVVYSDWITPNWVTDFNGTDAFYVTNKETTNSLLTKDAINKGLVYVYFKGNTQVYNQETKEYELKERINQNGFNSYFKIPGRITNKWYDFTTSNAYFDTKIGENFLAIYGYLDKRGYDETAKRFELPELAGKANSFYLDLLKNLHQYRIIVVNGSTKGRLASLDWNDYSAVKKALNLKD